MDESNHPRKKGLRSESKARKHQLDLTSTLSNDVQENTTQSTNTNANSSIGSSTNNNEDGTCNDGNKRRRKSLRISTQSSSSSTTQNNNTTQNHNPQQNNQTRLKSQTGGGANRVSLSPQHHPNHAAGLSLLGNNNSLDSAASENHRPSPNSPVVKRRNNTSLTSSLKGNLKDDENGEGSGTIEEEEEELPDITTNEINDDDEKEEEEDEYDVFEEENNPVVLHESNSSQTAHLDYFARLKSKNLITKEENTLEQPTGFYPPPCTSNSSKNFMDLDEKDRYKVKQRGKGREECGIIRHDPGQPDHGELLYCCTNIATENKETGNYARHSVFGTVGGKTSLLTVNNMRKDGGVVVRGGVLSVVLRCMLPPQQAAQWLPEGGIVNENARLWNLAWEKINLLNLPIYKIENMNTSPPVLLAEFTSEHLSSLPPPVQGTGHLRVLTLLRSRGLSFKSDYVIINETVTEQGHILEGLRISSTHAGSQEEYRSALNAFTPEGNTLMEMKAAQCRPPELHAHLQLNAPSTSPSDLQYIGFDKFIGVALGLTGIDTGSSSKVRGEYKKNMPFFKEALTTARIMISGGSRSSGMRRVEPYDPNGQATFEYGGRDYIYTTKRIPGSLDPIDE